MGANVFGIRFALTGIFAVTAFGFVVQPSRAQPGRPGFSGGGISGMPGRPGGSITGVPGGISGIGGSPLRPPGGITGISGAGIAGIHGTGISGIHGTGITGIHGAGIAGGIAGMPGGGITGIHGGGIGGLPGQTVYSWSCGKCKAHLGTTTTPHSHHTRCPVCGVFFTGSTINPGGGAGGGGAAGGGGGGGGGGPGGFAPVPTPPDEVPPLPVNPAAAPNPNPNDAPSFVAPPQTPEVSAPAQEEPEVRTPRAFKVIAILIGSVMLIVGLAALAVVVRNAGGQPVRRPRRRFDDDE